MRLTVGKKGGGGGGLKTLVKKELQTDAKTFGDDRRTKLVKREESQAIKEVDMLPNEPVTVVLSKKGWIRAAKGHEVDSKQLNYKSGDGFLSDALGRTNQQAIFFDSTGRSYTLAAHSLPSARGQGEPVTGRVNPPPGATFKAVVMGGEEDLIVMASSAGYGFIVPLKEVVSKNKNGKAVLKCPANSEALGPVLVNDMDNDLLVMISNLGRMLVFPVSELPELNRGKGNKMINIPTKLLASGDEWMQSFAIIDETQELYIYSGKRHLALKYKDLKHYQGERGRRGNKLPRGFQKVDSVEAK